MTRFLIVSSVLLTLGQSAFATQLDRVLIVNAEPTPSEVKAIDSKLIEFISSNTPINRDAIANIDQYKFQYAVLDTNKRTIFINAVCKAFWPRVSNWEEQLVVVKDGGSCYFQIKYDPSTEQFFEFFINGEV